jgi:predicted dienelactone hydrolase
MIRSQADRLRLAAGVSKLLQLSRLTERLVMTRRLVVGVTLVVALQAAAPFGQTGPVPHLPKPAGRFGVGRVSYQWTDSKRPDPFSSDSRARRELMVYLWYPIPAGQLTDQGVYQPYAKEINAAPGAECLRQSPIWASIASGLVKSHARDNATVAANPRSFPLVLFSHGDTAGNSFSYTSALEDFVSHGYVVATVEHPYSSSAVAFPDGRVIFACNRQHLRGDRPSGIPYFEGVQIGMKDLRLLSDIAAADLRFVLDQLEWIDTSDRSTPFFRRLDLGRIAAVGHSLGGMAVVRACQLDARIKACVNQDGNTPDGLFLRYIDAKPLKQPFLFVDATPPLTFTDEQLTERGITRAEWNKNADAVAETQRRQLRESLGGSYNVQLLAPGMNHESFGDALLSATTTEARQRALHNMVLTIDVTRSFLDKTLKGEANTLFDQASYSNPEVKIETSSGHR